MSNAEIMLDTNVISEIMRQDGSPAVLKFIAELPSPLMSVAVLHELQYGIELLPIGARRTRLSAGIERIRRQFGSCLIDVDLAIARASGELRAQVERRGAELKPMDSLIAASALLRGARLATRNIKHFSDLGIELVNPWIL